MHEEVEATVFEVLAHTVRRDILRLVAYSQDGASYTDMLGEFGSSTGRLNYHLKQMEGFIQKNGRLRYTLTPLGRAAADLMFSLRKGLPENAEKLVRVRTPPSLMPALKFMAYLLMFVVSIPVIFIGMQLYDTVVAGGQLIDILLLIVPMAIGIAVFVWIGYMVRVAPGYLRVLERRFYE
ncbi:MAG: helix-turn-helix transcriptional regulator [Candidatus Thorarchaeota archaeon]|nr:MAG: helix-turn-helix transcriptional regulator [Candidatus Thorarchaeota archaeon]